jgi:DNA-binding response OmpR family regulator
MNAPIHDGNPKSAASAVRMPLFPVGAEDLRCSPSRHILIVDDDPLWRDLVAVAMAEAGYHADTAHDGVEGWNALCQRNYDLVITDNEMPGLDGISLIKRLRANKDAPPCILITANLPCPESSLAEILRPVPVLEKPFSCPDLIEEVFSLLLRGGSPSSC